MIAIEVDANLVTRLQRALTGACGKLVRFLRIQTIAHSNNVKVWLCMVAAAVGLVITSVMRNLPAAEFGRITRV